MRIESENLFKWNDPRNTMGQKFKKSLKLKFQIQHQPLTGEKSKLIIKFFHAEKENQKKKEKLREREDLWDMYWLTREINKTLEDRKSTKVKILATIFCHKSKNKQGNTKWEQ